MQKKNFLRGRVVPDFPVDGHNFSLSAMVKTFWVTCNCVSPSWDSTFLGVLGWCFVLISSSLLSGNVYYTSNFS